MSVRDEQPSTQPRLTGVGLAIGAAIGTALSVGTGKPWLIAVGAGVGMVIGTWLSSRAN